MTGLVLLCVSLCSVVSGGCLCDCDLCIHHVWMMCWPLVGNYHMENKEDNDGVAPILGDASTCRIQLQERGMVGGGGGVWGWGELEKLEKWDGRDLSRVCLVGYSWLLSMLCQGYASLCL